MRCGSCSARTAHPSELFWEAWQDWGADAADKADLTAVAVHPVAIS